MICSYYHPNENYCYKYNFTPSEYNRLEKCLKGGGCDICFLTTVMCEILGKEDSCEELTSLRTLRDKYVNNSQELKSIIENYYNIAQNITYKLKSHEDRHIIAKQVYDKYIKDIILLVHNCEFRLAGDKYLQMVEYIQKVVEF